MAFTAFHNINTANDGIDIQLINYGERVSLKSLLLTNIDNAALTASLYLQDFTTGSKYYLLYQVSLPVGASLLLDSDDMLKFNNSSTGYSLNLTMGSTSDLINVLMST